MQTAGDQRIIITTVESDQQAATLAHDLVDQHLAACVTCLSGRSFFRWESDAVSDQKEIVLIVKTRLDKLPEIELYFASHHPYTCPELIALKMDQIGDAYTKWLATELDKE
jgi:periplasmic divalent cation tolerance protein